MTDQQRIDWLRVTLQMINNLLENELNDVARANAREIIRHTLKETE